MIIEVRIKDAAGAAVAERLGWRAGGGQTARQFLAEFLRARLEEEVGRLKREGAEGQILADTRGEFEGV